MFFRGKCKLPFAYFVLCPYFLKAWNLDQVNDTIVNSKMDHELDNPMALVNKIGEEGLSMSNDDDGKYDKQVCMWTSIQILPDHTLLLLATGPHQKIICPLGLSHWWAHGIICFLHNYLELLASCHQHACLVQQQQHAPPRKNTQHHWTVQSPNAM